MRIINYLALCFATLIITIGAIAQTPEIPSIGTPFLVSTLQLNLNSLARDGHKTFITFNKNSSSGYSLVMIENGELMGANPRHAFKFISVNLDLTEANPYKVINITDDSGDPIDYPVGRVSKCVMGGNHKLYVATEGSLEADEKGGGHLIEYDPFTQTAKDLGRPFFKPEIPAAPGIPAKPSKYLDIYSLNVGTDGNIYGGSFGNGNEFKIFYYEVGYGSNPGTIHISSLFTTLENNSFIHSITGDATHIYVTCGQIHWQLLAFEKSAIGAIDDDPPFVYVSGAGPNDRLEVIPQKNISETEPGAIFVVKSTLGDGGTDTYYQLTAGEIAEFATSPAPEANSYSRYNEADRASFNPIWDEKTRILQFTSYDSETWLNLSADSDNDGQPDVILDKIPTGEATLLQNRLFMGSFNRPYFTEYTPSFTSKWNTRRTNKVDMTSITNGTGNTIYMGSYPEGYLLSYDISSTLWNMNDNSVVDKPIGENPRVLKNLKEPISSVPGPIKVDQLLRTSSGIVVAGGNVDKIVGKKMAISTYDATTNTNTNKVFPGDEFLNMSLDYSGSNVIISAKDISCEGCDNDKLIFYNVSTHTVTNTIYRPSEIEAWGKIIMIADGIIFGYYKDMYYLYNMWLNEITAVDYIKSESGVLAGMNILAAKRIGATDDLLIVNRIGATSYQVRYLNHRPDHDNPSSHRTGISWDRVIGLLNDLDDDETTTPSFITTQFNSNGSLNIYISGLKKVYNISDYDYAPIDYCICAPPPGGEEFGPIDMSVSKTSSQNTSLDYIETDLQKKLSVKLFPNPGKDVLNLNFTGLDNKEQTVIRIMDVTGREVSKIIVGKTDSGKQSLNIVKWPAGFYFVELVNGKKRLHKQFIKQ